jgi:hypothetical protein
MRTANTAMIGKVEFKHYPREANRVAHVIARNSVDSKSYFSWVDDVTII